MVCYSPTLIPPPLLFPILLPSLPRPYPTPLPLREPNTLLQRKARFHGRRDWAKELEELSEEEGELEDMTNEIQHRGFTFLVPIGRTLTQQEEKNDTQGDGSSTESSSHSGMEEGENDADDQGQPDGDLDPEGDLDAEMEDYDREPDDEEEGDDVGDETFSSSPLGQEPSF